MVVSELDNIGCVNIIFYTGIGDYRPNHLYYPHEFIILINKNYHRFNQNDDVSMPILNQNYFTIDELKDLVKWTGGIIF